MEDEKQYLSLLQKNKDFFEQVYAVVAAIPKGRVTSYGAIARYLSTPQAARMVGWAMNAAHKLAPHLAAHRVVNRNGMLTGKHHFDTPTTMQERLAAEGILVEKDCIHQFEKLFWDPSQALSL